MILTVNQKYVGSNPTPAAKIMIYKDLFFDMYIHYVPEYGDIEIITDIFL